MRDFLHYVCMYTCYVDWAMLFPIRQGRGRGRSSNLGKKNVGVNFERKIKRSNNNSGYI